VAYYVIGGTSENCLRGGLIWVEKKDTRC